MRTTWWPRVIKLRQGTFVASVPPHILAILYCLKDMKMQMLSFKLLYLIWEVPSLLLLLADHPRGGEDCAFKHMNVDVWESHPCDKKHSYICYDERLVLVKKMSTWEEALRYCRALEAVDSSKPATFHQNHRYDLATLLTPDDMAYARWMAQGATTHEVGRFSARACVCFPSNSSSVLTALCNVGRCGRAGATWLASGCGWAEKRWRGPPRGKAARVRGSVASW